MREVKGTLWAPWSLVIPSVDFKRNPQDQTSCTETHGFAHRVGGGKNSHNLKENKLHFISNIGKNFLQLVLLSESSC